MNPRRVSSDWPEGAETGRAGRVSPKRVPRWKLALIASGLVVVAASPWWGLLILRRLDFFHVRRIEIVGGRYIVQSDIVTLLHVDTLASVWDPTGPLVARIARQPQVERVTIHRKLPGTLVVDITENLPVALVPSTRGLLSAYDARGVQLPIDLARIPVDAPVLCRPDPALLRLLGSVRAALPILYGRISEVCPEKGGEFLFTLDELPVRTMADVTVDELNQVDPVERDLAARSIKATELDLRFKDQVIAKLP